MVLGKCGECLGKSHQLSLAARQSHVLEIYLAKRQEVVSPDL